MAPDVSASKSETQSEAAKSVVRNYVKGKIDEGRIRRMQRGVAQEIGEPEGYFNIWAMGPFQTTGPAGPLLPHKVIKVGETFQVATVLWLSDAVLPGIGPFCDFVTNLGSGFRVEYCTNDMCKLIKAPQFSVVQPSIPLVPGDCFYVDVQTFTAAQGTESCIYEMNICVRCEGCQPGSAPVIAGFATAVYDFDPDLFYPPPGGTPTFPPSSGSSSTPPGGATPQWYGWWDTWKFDNPIRFQIYP